MDVVYEGASSWNNRSEMALTGAPSSAGDGTSRAPTINTEPRSSATIASLVIPAHNEESVIGRCLAKLLADARPGELEVIVVCNGCQDRTAAVARSFSRVQVGEIPQASKIAALNVGDGLATGYPRIYLDADVELTTDSVRHLVAALLEQGILIAEPKLQLDMSGASHLIRAHGRALLRLVDDAGVLVGAGVLALSEAGRCRFGQFPDIMADDLFVRNLFSPQERAIVKTATSTVRTPRNLRTFVRVKSRVAAANRIYWRSDLPRSSRSRSSPIRTLLALMRRPEGWLDAVAYVGLAAAVRLNVRLSRLSHRGQLWERDETTRSTAA